MLKIITTIESYKPWNGATHTWRRIEEEGKIDELDQLLDELYPEGLEEMQLNDLLWFDSDWVLESLGIITDSYIDEARYFLKSVLDDFAGFEIELRDLLETLADSEYRFDIDYHFDYVYDQEVCNIDLSLDDNHISDVVFQVVEKYEKEEYTILVI